MLNRENVLSKEEIVFLDNLFHISGYRDLSEVKVKEDILIEKTNDTEKLDSLRAKGIVRTKETKYINHQTESLLEETVKLVELSLQELCDAWLSTVYFRSGKSLEKDIFTEETRQEGSFICDLSNEDLNLKLVFITKKINDVSLLTTKDSIFISFVPIVNHIEEDGKIDWNAPLEDPDMFFRYLNEQSKKFGSENYEFINLPLGLKKDEEGDILNLVTNLFAKVKYKELSNVDDFKPELNDYLLSINQLNLGFKGSSGDIKIFVNLQDSRLRFYVFINGIKKINDEVYSIISILRSQIENRSSTFVKIRRQISVSLLSETKKLLSIIVPMLISIVASGSLILQEFSVIKSFQGSSIFLALHVIFGVISILLFILFGIVPTIRHMYFSWEKGLNNQIKKSKK